MAASLQAHEPVADSGEGSEQHPVGDLDVADPKRGCERRLHRHKGRSGLGVALVDQLQAGQGEQVVDLVAPRTLIGKSTVDAIRSGVMYGYAGQVDGILRRLRAELGEELEAIATGGLAAHIVPFCEEIDDTDDLLTLTGLRLLHERNA